MGGMFSKPKMPKIEQPKMPPTPRMPTETDPDLLKRQEAAKLKSKKGSRQRTLLSENTRTKQSGGQSLGGGGFSSNVG